MTKIHDAEKTIKELQDRCGALESLLAECGSELCWSRRHHTSPYKSDLISRVGAILPNQPEEI